MAWNVLGTGLPLAVALWAIPRLVEGLGLERFGILALVWALVGYFSLFDLGASRALTKLVAERLGGGRQKEIAPLVRGSLRLLHIVGLLVAPCLAGIAPWAVGRLFAVSPLLMREAGWSLAIAALSLPLVISTAAFVGVLQAHQRFRTVAAIQAGIGVAVFLGPVAALALKPSLVVTTLALVVARLLGWVAFRQACLRLLRGLDSRPQEAGPVLRELLSFGVWVSITNVVGPLMLYLDRFLIGSLLTMAAVTYYATPYEVVTRLWVIADGIVAVLFPALTTAMVYDTTRARIIFATASRAMLLAVGLPAAMILLFAPEVLQLWLGTHFANESAPVARWLAVGVFANAAARLPFVALHARGRPDVTAKLHLIELPIYLCILWVFVESFGIEGAAAAWTLRAAGDAAALFFSAMRLVPELSASQLRTLLGAVGGLAVLSALPAVHSPGLRIVIATGLVAGASGLVVRDLRVLRMRPSQG
ncbi:MAG TPA: flippase [Vicinamibacterales bacterium]|nr:flippase [Vicinamibacterales bacterium]